MILEAAKMVWDLCREVLDDPDPRVKVFALFCAVMVLLIVVFAALCVLAYLSTQTMAIVGIILAALLTMVTLKVISRVGEAGHARALGHGIYKVEHQFTAATATYGYGAGGGTMRAEAAD